MQLQRLRNRTIDEKYALINKYQSEGFNTFQVSQVQFAIDDEWDDEVIAIFARKSFTYEQMKEIRVGLYNKHSRPHFNLFASPAFSPQQMQEIIIGLNRQIDANRVKLYANPAFTVSEMSKIRKKCMVKKDFDALQAEITLMLLEKN